MNLGEIIAECGRLLSDPNNERWTTALLTTRANLAQTEIITLTKCNRHKVTYTPTLSTHEITLNTTTIDVVRAYKTLSNGSVVPFTGITPEELDLRFPNWEQWEDGEPLFWWYSFSSQQFKIVPAPDAANVITDGIHLWTVKNSAAMTTNSQIPFDQVLLLVPYHMAIVHWVVAQCWMDDGTPEALGKATFHKSGDMDRPGQYEMIIKKLTARFDNPTSIARSVMWKPQGGRIGSYGMPTKSYPLRG